VRWVESLRQRDDVAVAFYPVSVRFRTNLSSLVFSALTARLVVLFGEKPPTSADMPEGKWRWIMGDYLQRDYPGRRKLVMVLDGLDEFAGYEPGTGLLPVRLGDQIRVVVAARSSTGEPWLQRLGWERPDLAREIDLDPLGQQGIADVLNRMAFPLDRLAVRVDIVAELYRLSEGDPLLVRRYVEDLWQRGEEALQLRPEDLATIERGLEGYFRRWWEDQRKLWGRENPLAERQVQELLNLLACAFGPLRREDLLTVADPGAGLSTWTLDGALRPLQRFIIGDGEEQGYTFSHPRLSYFFYDRLAVKERQAMEDRFIAWGQSVMAELEIEGGECEVPSYVVQYHAAHLKRADARIQVFLKLVSNGWQRAWFRLVLFPTLFHREFPKFPSHATASEMVN